MIGSSRPPSTKKLEDTLSYPKLCHNMNQNSHNQFLGTKFFPLKAPNPTPQLTPLSYTERARVMRKGLLVPGN